CAVPAAAQQGNTADADACRCCLTHCPPQQRAKVINGEAEPTDEEVEAGRKIDADDDGPAPETKQDPTSDAEPVAGTATAWRASGHAALSTWWARNPVVLADCHEQQRPYRRLHHGPRRGCAGEAGGHPCVLSGGGAGNDEPSSALAV